MKLLKLAFWVALLGVAITFIAACKEESPKCKEASSTSTQTWTSFYNLGEYANVEGDVVEYTLKFGFLEVCTFSRVHLDVKIEKNFASPTLYFAFISVEDTQGNVGLGWTSLGDPVNSMYQFQKDAIRIPGNTQETPVWVNLKFQLPIAGFNSLEEAHSYMENELENIEVNLTFHKPNYE